MNGEEAVNTAHLIYSSSVAELLGPLKWRFVAKGVQGQHQSMEIKQVQVETMKSKRRLVINSSSLGGVIAFKSDQSRASRDVVNEENDLEFIQGIEENPWVASYEIPDVLQLYPAVDGKIVVAAKIEITTNESTETEWVNFAILPANKTAKTLCFRRTMIEFDGVPIQ